MLLAKRNKGEHAIADFDPFSALSLFDELWPSSIMRAGEKPYMPEMDVTETDADYRIRLEAAGMDKKDFKIEFENGILTVSGEKKSEVEEKKEKVYRLERRYGAFSRSLRFTDVDGEKISAAYSNGVLEVTVPKTEKPQPKKIDIA